MHKRCQILFESRRRDLLEKLINIRSPATCKCMIRNTKIYMMKPIQIYPESTPRFNPVPSSPHQIPFLGKSSSAGSNDQSFGGGAATDSGGSDHELARGTMHTPHYSGPLGSSGAGRRRYRQRFACESSPSVERVRDIFLLSAFSGQRTFLLLEKLPLMNKFSINIIFLFNLQKIIYVLLKV